MKSWSACVILWCDRGGDDLRVEELSGLYLCEPIVRVDHCKTDEKISLFDGKVNVGLLGVDMFDDDRLK